MVDIDLAKIDPSAVYIRPSDVLSDVTLSREQKIDILERWAYDEREKAVAEEENMPDLTMQEINRLDEILRCLIKLGVNHDTHPAPTEQG